MRNFYLIDTVDVVPLTLALFRNPDLWREDTYLRDYPQGPFGEVDTIMLRFPVKTVLETERELEEYGKSDGQHESIDYPPYKTLHEARPIVNWLMARVQGERLGRVMINRVAPGGRIFPHADTPVHAEYYTRFHVVLVSAPGVDFRCEDEHAYFPPGSVFWFNNKLEHEVVNNSDRDRIHMVVDIRTPR